MDNVNEHYLERVVAIAETTQVEATEDILSGTGIKLVARGGRIDARVRERLLEHKLRKPLETMLRVVDGVASRPIDRVAQALLERHSLLAGVCGARTAKVVERALHDLRLPTALESMLSVYAGESPRQLEHAVGVSLFAAAMIHPLPEADESALHTLLVAGLVHDIGELYIAPAILQAGAAVTPEQWRHIAAHPVIASHVLRTLPGAGPRVADAVLQHHERLDGFGYPRGLAGAALSLPGQVLGLAEVLMGISERGRSPGEHAAVAVKLVPGEFERRLGDHVARAAATARGSDVAEQALTPPDPAGLADRAAALTAALHALQADLGALEATLGGAGAGVRALATQVAERLRRLHMAYSSTGLDACGPAALPEELERMEAREHFEIGIVLREIDWRLNELRRELQARSAAFADREASVARRLLDAFDRALAAGKKMPTPLAETKSPP